MTDVTRLKNRARREEQRGNWDAAIDLYRRALLRSLERSDSAADLSLFNRIGDIQRRQGDPEAAVATYEQAVSAYAARDLHTSAIALCNKILRVMPERAEAYRSLGRLRLAIGLVAQARADYLRHAAAMRERGRPDAAAEGLEECLLGTSDPEVAAAFVEAVETSGDRGDAAERIQRVARALEEAGGDPRPLRRAAGLADPGPVDTAPSPDGAVDRTAAAGPPTGALPLEGMAALEAELEAAVGGEGEAGAGTAGAGGAEVPPSSPPPPPAREAPESPILPARPAPDDAAAPVREPPRRVRPPSRAARPAAPGREPPGPVRSPSSRGRFVALVRDASEASVVRRCGFRRRPGSERPERARGPAPGRRPAAPLLTVDWSVRRPPEPAERSRPSRRGSAAPLPGEGPEGPVPAGVAAVASGGWDRDPVEPLRAAARGASLPAPGREEAGGTVRTLPCGGRARARPRAERPDAGPRAAGAPRPERPSPEDAEGDAELPPETGRRFPFGEVRSPSGEVGEARAGAADGGSGAPRRSDPAAASGPPSESGPPDEETSEAGFYAWLETANPEVLERSLDELARRGEVERALDVIEALLEHRPAEPGLHRKRIARAQELGDEDRLDRAYVAFALSLADLGRSEEAREVCRELIRRIGPDDARVQRVLDRLDADGPGGPSPAPVSVEGETDERPAPAGEEEPSGAEPAPWDPASGAAARGVDFDVILSELKEQLAERVVDTDIRSRTELGERLKEMGLLDDAIRELQAAVRVPGAPPRAYELLGEAFIEKGQARVATRLLSDVVKESSRADRELLGILYHLGVAYQEVGETPRALECFERIFSIDIDYRDVQERIASCA